MTTLAVQPGSLHASLIDALSGPEPERALEQAFLQLSRGGELPLVLAMLKALVRVGLAGVAVRLLKSAGGLLAAEPQLAALADQLAAMPQGEVPRSILSARFQANVTCLLKTHPYLHQFVEQWARAIEDACVYRSATGNVHAVRESAEGHRLDLVFPFADQIIHARSLKLPELSLSSSFLLIGVPAPALFDRLQSLKTAAGYEPPVDIVETDPQVFGLWLHMVDNAAAFDGERVNIFIGDHAVNEYRDFLVNHSWRRPATHCTTNFRPRWTPPEINGRFHNSVAEAIGQRQQRDFRSLESRYANRDAVYWSYRFQQALTNGPPLRIAGFTTRYSTVIQHSMRDLAAAFERCGHAFDIIKQPNTSCAHVDVTGPLLKRDYDLIVVIDHLRSEFTGSIPLNVPFVCWIQDHMDALYTRDAGRSVTHLDVVIGHSPGLMCSSFAYPQERFIASCNLTDAHIYSDEPLPEAELAPYRCDVSYVGHGSVTPRQLAIEIAPAAPGSFARMLDRFVTLAQRQFQDQNWLTFAERMELALQAERETGHPPMSPAIRRRIMIPAIDRLFDRMVRHETLQWTADWTISRGRTFHIYGRGWDKHPTLSRFANGEVANGGPLRRAYQASSVSLQVTGYSSLHQRLLDGLASGAFMLTRFNPFDFVRQPHAVVAGFIERNDIDSLNALLAQARMEPELARAIDRLHSLGHARLADSTDRQRLREAAIYRDVFDASSETMSDWGLFEAVRSGRYIPHRSACDLHGFEMLTFKDRQSLYCLLDRFIEDSDARRSAVAPMRQAVLANDTYDALVRVVLGKFAQA